MATLTVRNFTQSQGEKFPEGLPATEPPEARGLRRDHVRLLVLDRFTGEIQHSRFDKLGQFLHTGDVLVLNDSRTLPVLLDALLPNGERVSARLARDEDGLWTCALSQEIALRPEDVMLLAHGRLLARVLGPMNESSRYRVQLSSASSSMFEDIYHSGHPVSYSHLSREWDLDYFQTVYAAHPGSAEMPSAGRPFSWELLFRLRQQGITIATITLHTTLGPQEDESLTEPPAEEYFMSPHAAHQINEARSRRGRVVAVGTTVIRALETAATADGVVHAGHDWTRLHITPDYQLKIVNGLISGFHECDSSHLDLITALVSREKLWNAYKIATETDYRWHEFGDANLIL
ncbi:S-adenosylmethionine:tRNA ribosyltransferase-isomerase [Candidatus Acetothermia bacterium]|nr:S-adenosylmethionine:tRNA ribosyltransferase-isomerase [Candidatus Acetothermia bacterium]